MDHDSDRHRTTSPRDAGHPAPDDRREAPPASDETSLARALERVSAQFALLTPRPDAVRRTCDAVRAALPDPPDDATIARVADALGPHLRSARGEPARLLFDLLEALLPGAADPARLAGMLLQARDAALRRRAVRSLLAHATATAAPPGTDLVDRLATAILTDLPAGDLAADDAALLDRAATFLRRLAPDERDGDGLEALVMGGETGAVRRLAARILDRDGAPIPPARLERLLGTDAAARLGDLLQYTRVSHRDLVDLTPDGALAPATCGDLAAALDALGQSTLGAVIGELGWNAVSCGLCVERRLGVSVDGSFPFLVAPEEAGLLEACGEAHRVWDRTLVVAHGGKGGAATTSDREAEAVARFRRYNLLHAELLGEILEVAPVTPAKVARIVAQLDEVVEHFVALFADHTDEAKRLPGWYGDLRARVLAAVDGVADDQPLESEPTRLVQMFEDPRTLDEVRTLHGLKRYLHQLGLRLAFRRFRSTRTTNRTVDLAVVSGGRVLHTLRKIRYLDFEPHAAAAGIPFLPALAVEALGRRLLHGATDAPDLEILIYGNEVQTFVNFLNHPAFLRIDFSPPLRGGMIDLEYFGVSQYELDHHPALDLPWIQRVFRRLDFDVQADGVRLHVRYDKERAFDFGDLTRGVRVLCALLPHLMDLDWTLGGLRYPEPAKAAIADHWADWLANWGLLPLDDLLTGDRRAILAAVRDDPSGPVEVPWDGRGEVGDRFGGRPAADFWARLQQALADRGAPPCPGWTTFQEAVPAQIPLQEVLLAPTQAERPAAETDPTLRLAGLLAGGGNALAPAARLARVVAAVERHLRFATVGAVQGFPVQQATLLLRGELVEIAVLRDGAGLARLAVARERPFRFVPGPRPAVRAGEVDAPDLAARLRRDNYVAASFEPPSPRDEAEVAATPAAFMLENPLAAPAPDPGDRILAGVAAAPGKATGIAVFYRPGLTPDDVDGAVLFAAALRPEDAPLLRRAAGVVSTGGGVLSHAGLIAQELGKPALLVDGCWRNGERGRPALACHTTDYVEETHTVGPYRATVRRDRRERQEVLEEGDLVVVDAELGSLGVLGQDRDALALQEESRRLDAVVVEMARHGEGPQRLALRGRLLRATHQLAKLLARIESPTLARHAARELLKGHRRAAVAADASLLGGTGRPGLLQHLFENPRCGEAARQAARREETLLSRRLAALCEESRRTIDGAETPHEVLFLRRSVARLQQLLLDARHALAEAGALDAAVAADCARLEDDARRRLETLRRRHVDDLERVADDPAAWWRVRTRRQLLAALDDLLGPAPDRARHAAVANRARRAAVAGEQRALARAAGRAIITPDDGGRELAPLIGAKGAGLGEIARILGPARVPPWFVVGDTALQGVLTCGVGRLDDALGVVPGTPLLLAIRRVLEHPDLDVRAQAAAIRAAWRTVELPDDLADRIRAAYRDLVASAPSAGGPDRDLVAVRSSAFEEDAARSSWAGQFDTFLCVHGADAVLEHLKLAWASLWSERVLVHRRALAADDDEPLPDAPGGGVIIQRLVDSRAAGVVHTLSAASGQPREMVLNVGLGLGEGVVSGTVEVDHVVVSRVGEFDQDHLRFRYTVGDKRTRVVRDRRTGHGTRIEDTLYHQRLRPALEYPDLCELVEASARLEAAYGHPLDLEFAFEDDRLYILQARPIVAFQEALRDAVNNPPWAAAGPATEPPPGGPEKEIPS